MVYSISGNKAIISGNTGIYDKTIKSPDVRYGRNAAHNYKTYIQDIACGAAPVQFAYQYIPQGKLSTQALMGNAYEELGKKTEVSVEELNKRLDKTSQEIKKLNLQILTRNPEADIINPDYSAEALDLNNDGKIDIAEYATSTLAADMLDADPTQCNINSLDGVITNRGENASMGLYSKQNIEGAKGLFKAIHDTFKLDKAMQEFKTNPNNMI
ncbi:MAG: hypothetical protein ACI4S3_08885 [Candidatus Gastranaerophilaceae bacterium]